MSEKINNAVREVLGREVRAFNRIPFAFQKDTGKIVLFDTSVGTDNLGDFIIMHYCNLILKELFDNNEFINVSTHIVPTEREERIVKSTKYKFVCGTNLLTSHIEQWWNWRLPDGFRKKLNYRNVILLGTGWGVYQDECSAYSKLIYRSMLNPRILHSVRDQYTEDKLKAIGITNVINTGCPTMWKLTPAFCKDIPFKKSNDVITTITDYRRDVESDNLLLSILGRNYDNVYLWLQGKSDEEYLKTLKKPDNLIIVPGTLEAYQDRLNQGNIDYVGTRLHAGIFALNHKVRSIIIAVDNRAIEIAKDTNLPIVFREQLGEKLEKTILSVFSTEIQLKQNNINRFKAQFTRNNNG